MFTTCNNLSNNIGSIICFANACSRRQLIDMRYLTFDNVLPLFNLYLSLATNKLNIKKSGNVINREVVGR